MFSFAGAGVATGDVVSASASFWRSFQPAYPTPEPRIKNGNVGITENLLPNVRSDFAVGAGSRDDQTAGDGHHQRRDHRDQTISDCQDGIGGQGTFQIHAVLKNADQKSRNNIDRRDQNAGNCVTLREPGSAIHGPVEFGFGRQVFAPGARFHFVNQPSVEIGVNRHLFAGQSVQGEARGDF